MNIFETFIEGKQYTKMHFALINFPNQTVTEPQRLTVYSSKFDQALVRACFRLVTLL